MNQTFWRLAVGFGRAGSVLEVMVKFALPRASEWSIAGCMSTFKALFRKGWSWTIAAGAAAALTGNIWSQ